MIKEKHIFALASILIGFGVYLAVCKVSGRREAWDAAMYYYAAMPFFAVVSFGIAYRVPGKSWRWPLGIAIGQSLADSFRASDFSLWPLAIIFLLVIAIPNFIASRIGSYLGAKRKRDI